MTGRFTRALRPRAVGTVLVLLAVWLYLYEVGVIYEFVLYPYSLIPAVILLALGVALLLRARWPGEGPEARQP